jgi:branched-chain amino acid transport system ATP-binding protein
MSTVPLLQVHDLSSSYGRVRALSTVSLEIGRGELVALVGSNGAGKTTLLRCLSGVQPIDGGAIRFDGRDINHLRASERVALGIAQVPEGRLVFPQLSIEDNLLLGGYGRDRNSVSDGFARAYAMFPILAERRRQLAGTLSGGQQQMLALGRALMSAPRLLLLDEPSMGLAPVVVERIFDIIEQLRASGTTILLVEQNANAALALADRGYVIETGRIVLAGGGSDLLEDRRVREAYLGV